MESSYDIEHIFNHKLYLDYKELCELTLYITKYKLDIVKLIKIINEINKIMVYISDNITDKTILNNKYKINLNICDILDYHSRKQQILLKNNIECQLMIYYKNLDEIKHKCISYVNDILHKGIFSINYIQEHLYDYYYYSRKNKDVEIDIFYYIISLMYNILYCIRAEECDDTDNNKKYYISIINLLDKINILLNIYQTNINENKINQFNYIQNIYGDLNNNNNIYLYCSTILLPNIYNLMLYILFNKKSIKNEDFNKLLTIKIIKNDKKYNFKQLFDELYKDIISKLEK